MASCWPDMVGDMAGDMQAPCSTAPDAFTSSCIGSSNVCVLRRNMIAWQGERHPEQLARSGRVRSAPETMRGPCKGRNRPIKTASVLWWALVALIRYSPCLPALTILGTRDRDMTMLASESLIRASAHHAGILPHAETALTMRSCAIAQRPWLGITHDCSAKALQDRMVSAVGPSGSLYTWKCDMHGLGVRYERVRAHGVGCWSLEVLLHLREE